MVLPLLEPPVGIDLWENAEGRLQFRGRAVGTYYFTDYSTTGDGLFTALQLLKVVQERGSSFSELTGILPCFPY